MVASDPLTVVTSWSHEGGCLYGDRFLHTYRDTWGGSESDPKTRPGRGIPLRIWSDDKILQDPEVRAFRDREADAETTRPNDLHRGVMKWSWKVFALTMEPMPTSGWMIWIDGDVEFTKTPTQEFFAAVCPDTADVSFLDRPWAYASETGFVAYRMESPAVQELLRLMRHTYISGEFRNLSARTGGAMPEWGDAAVFDYCRGVLLQEGAGLRENNLCPGNKPRDGLHVWPQTVLAEFMCHRKGANRKREAYGGAV